MSEQESLLPSAASDLRMLEHATARYELAISDAEGFLQRRGISAGAAGTFRLGVVRDPLPEHEQYEGMLCIPYVIAEGQVVQLRFRCLADHKCSELGHGKYQTVSGDRGRLFNVPALLGSAKDLHVCEGELDCVTLTQIGLNAIAVPGVKLWKPHHRVMCSGFERVFVWGDGDQAGQEFSHTIRNDLRGAMPVKLPYGEDVNSLFVQHGPDVLRGLLRDVEEVYS